MKSRTFLFLGTALVIVIILGAAIYLEPLNPAAYIKEEIGITLPRSAKVLNYTYERNENYFCGKISIGEQDVEELKNRLESTFGKSSDPNVDLPNVPCPWWDFRREDILAVHRVVENSKQTIIQQAVGDVWIWTFVCRDSNGEYYLYIII